MNQKNFLRLIVFITVITAVLSVFLFNFLQVDVYRVKYDFRVASDIGLNADTDYLHFGGVPPGSSGFRGFFVSNDKCDLCNVRISASGDGSNWIRLSEDSFEIYGNQTKDILATLYVPSDAKFGEYKGELTIYFWKGI